MSPEDLQRIQSIVNIFVGVFQVIGAAATALAFWVTYLTLRELKRQTDLANNPILKLRFRLLDALPDTADKLSSIKLDYYDLEPHQNWLNIITRNLEQELGGLKDQFLCIELTNSGKSEITNITFDLVLSVAMLPSDILGYDILPKDYRWKLDLTVELSEKAQILLPITNTRYFPEFSCSVMDLEFRDIRGSSYTKFNGPPTTGEEVNEILRPRQPVDEPEAEPEVEPETEPEVEPEAEPEAEPEVEPEVEPTPKVISDPDMPPDD